MLGAVLGVLALAASGRAQERGFALNRYQPADDPAGFFSVASPSVNGDRALSAALVADYAHAPLVLRTVDGGLERGEVVSGQLFLHATLAYALWNRLLVSLAVPFAASNSGHDVMPPDGPVIPAPRGAAFGDVALGGRLRLLGRGLGPLALGMGVRLWVPSGQQAAYTGDGRARAALDLVIGGQMPFGLIWSASAAGVLRGRAQLLGTVSDDEIQFAGAAGYRLARDRLLIGPEVVASVIPGAAGSIGLAQVLVSARYQAGSMIVGLSAGPGLGRATGTPSVRLLASVGFAPAAPGRSNAEPTSALTFARPVAPDGAPGAPSAADRDGDGISDQLDRCPRERGPSTHDPKSNGCPSLVRVTEYEIVTLKKVHFVSGMARLHPDASELLSQVAQVLIEHPEIRRVLIEGHTDGRGGDKRNLALSTARARTVRLWLIKKGIAPERLEAQGYGASRRLEADDTIQGRERNRRVEFRILDPAPVDVSASEIGSGP